MSALVVKEEEITGKPLDMKLVTRLLGYMRRHLRLFAFSLVLVSISACTPLLFPLLIGETINTVKLSLESGDVAAGKDALLMLVVFFFSAAIVKWLSEVSSVYFVQVFGQRVIYDIRVPLFAHIQRLPMSFFNRNYAGALVTRVSNDVEALNEFVTAGLITVMTDILMIAGIMVLLPMINFKLGMIAIAVIPALIVVTLVYRVLARKAYRIMRRQLSRMTAYVAENINGIRVTKAFVREKKQLEMFDAENDDYLKKQHRSFTNWWVYSSSITFFTGVSLALVIYFGASGVLAGEIEIGTMFAFILYVKMYFDPIRDFAEKYNVFQAAMASSERIFKILDEKEDPALLATKDLPSPLRGAISFRDVVFAYQEDKPVLRGISFDVQPGEKIALVGHTGAGKSTIIKLLMRFWDVTSGAIEIDGEDIKTISPKSLRSVVGVVHQDVFLFNGTVMENIRLWNTSISDSKVREACRRVSADGFITSRSDGYDHNIQEGGVVLSSGERQLLSFARAIAYDPTILILDEATALVDTETEQIVQEALEELTKDRTSIIIAHRLSTIKNCDTILHLKDGEIIERGTHDELVEAGGEYAQQYKLQTSEFEG
ncbi:MAG: ABC transporter ATP-binding protein/permease [Planctomycetes bacterium]|nr:ABC transporter ATP-binding protein/permease [Planctomycetota bacterium]